MELEEAAEVERVRMGGIEDLMMVVVDARVLRWWCKWRLRGRDRSMVVDLGDQRRKGFV